MNTTRGIMRRCSISMMSATSARDCGTSRRGVDTVVEFKDGTKVTLPGNDVEHMRQMSQPIVPAAPGLYEVRFFFWDETPSAAAVLAFLACAYTMGVKARASARNALPARAKRMDILEIPSLAIPKVLRF